MELISKKRLYEKIARLEMEAKKKLAKTPRDSEEYIRYETQFNERSAFKHMVMDEREVDVAQKLASYEEAEEQGLLLRLPCEIGDTMWAVRNYRGVKYAQQGIVSEIFLNSKMKLIIVVKHVARGEFGEKVFKTQAEAEKALAEMGE